MTLSAKSSGTTIVTTMTVTATAPRRAIAPSASASTAVIAIRAAVPTIARISVEVVIGRSAFPLFRRTCLLSTNAAMLPITLGTKVEVAMTIALAVRTFDRFGVAVKVVRIRPWR